MTTTTLRPTILLGLPVHPAGLCRKASYLSPGLCSQSAVGSIATRQQPGGVSRPYGCRRHLRISQRRRRIVAAKRGLFVVAMVIAMGPAALAVWAWGQLWGWW